MMEFFKGLFATLVMKVLAAYQAKSLHLLRIHATKMYVTAVGKAREAFIASLGLSFLLMLFACGFVLIHVGLVAAMLVYDVDRKIIVGVLVGLGILYMLVPVCILRKVSSEELWMKGSGAEKLLHEALKRKT